MQVFPLLAQLLNFRRQPRGVAPLFFGQPLAGQLFQPGLPRRDFQPAIIDRHALHDPVAGQHCSVAGEYSASRRGQRLLPSDRPPRLRAEGRALADLQLRRAAPDDQQQHSERGDAPAQPPLRIDHRRGLAAETQFLPVGGHDRLIYVARPPVLVGVNSAQTGRCEEISRASCGVRSNSRTVSNTPQRPVNSTVARRSKRMLSASRVPRVVVGAPRRPPSAPPPRRAGRNAPDRPPGRPA